jgi:hypothetical protein
MWFAISSVLPVTQQISRTPKANSCTPSGKLVASHNFSVAIGDQATIFFDPCLWEAKKKRAANN